ncbi:MAG: XAC2610-related protein [Thiolinea sp.]
MIMKKTGVIIVFIFLLSGCNSLPPAQAETYLQPPVSTVLHKLNFDVRAGLRAQVSLSETQIMVQVNNTAAVKVSKVNLPLLREWGRYYLKINDYDRDGMNDLAILTTAGRGGKNLCYAVYRYNPRTGKFRERKSFDRCNI